VVTFDTTLSFRGSTNETANMEVANDEVVDDEDAMTVDNDDWNITDEGEIAEQAGHDHNDTIRLLNAELTRIKTSSKTTLKRTLQKLNRERANNRNMITMNVPKPNK
jgi:sulfur relay (sulfurtransferase) DsrC/TusE family protein